MKIMNWKEGVIAILGAIGAIMTSIFGGWDSALQTLIIFMVLDYISGLIVAGFFHASPKTKNGALESKVGWKGLCRKGGSLLIVLIAYRLDLLAGTCYIRDAAVIAFIVNEGISIIENVGCMGIPIPSVIAESIEMLSSKNKKNEDRQH